MQPNVLTNVTCRISGHYGKVRCEPGWSWSPQPLPDYDLWYVMDGTGTMRIDGIEYEAYAGACFLVRPGDMPEAQQRPDDRLKVIFIHFSPLEAESGRPIHPPLPIERRTIVQDKLAFERVLIRIVELQEQRGPWIGEEIDVLLKQALYQLMRYGSPPASASELSERYRQAVARISVYLREKCAERITVNEAAAAVGLSAAYASLLFKKTTGMSLKAYMTKVRMERAMHLLTETTMNVSQIADALGYTSVYLFSRQFSRHFDAPPSHYRQRAIPTKPTGRRQPSTPIE